jgi:hypothetical protein
MTGKTKSASKKRNKGKKKSLPLVQTNEQITSEEELPQTSPSPTTSKQPKKLNSVQNNNGRTRSEVWEHFNWKRLKSAGHFSAECKYCRRYWSCGKPGKLEEHLANECPKAPDIIRSYYVNVVASRGSGRKSSNNSKKRKFDVNNENNQREIHEWFEPTTLPDHKSASITRALVRAFVCCGISFSIIENPFFLDFLHEMRFGYEPPSREMLSGSLLEQEVARVNKKVNETLSNAENLTLGIRIFFL